VLETLGNTSIGEYDEQHILERAPRGELENELVVEISTNPSILRGVALVIANLITIYDIDLEDVDIAVPILNEVVSEILDTQLSQGPQPLDIEKNLNIAEGYITSSDQVSQPMAKGEICKKV
jgi:hypothetical protein